MDFGIKQISIQNYPLLGLLSKYFVKNCFVLHTVQKAWGLQKLGQKWIPALTDSLVKSQEQKRCLLDNHLVSVTQLYNEHKRC